MDSKEYIFDQALKELKNTTSFSDVSLNLAQNKEELLPLLKISSMLNSLPKTTPPTPAMRRLYISKPIKTFAFAWLHVSRFMAMSVSGILLFSAFAGLSFGAYNSMPGQTLFSLKHASEQIQLKLAVSDQAKANLQIKIAQKRLNEAESILNNPSADPKDEKAALTALVSETKNSIQQVSLAAKNNSLNNSGHPLVASLENLNKQQQKLINNLKPAADLNEETKNTLTVASEENSNKLNEIKNYIAIASNETTLVDLDSIKITGFITKIDKDSLSVENTLFVFDPTTTIKNSKDEPLTWDKLELKNKVNVVGKKQDDKIFAKNIILLLPETSGEVKGSQTTTPNQVPNSTTPTSIESKKEKIITPEKNSEEILGNTTVGSFILEDPSPQLNR
jgi:hypothetical protein